MEKKEPFFKIVNEERNTEVIFYLRRINNDSTIIDSILSDVDK